MVTYLDHAATTPVRPSVIEAMTPYWSEQFGNPSGSHAVGRRARQAIDEARDEVAELLGCEPREVVFTSGGTESDNLAILGVHSAKPGLVICSAIEHHAVLNTVAAVDGVVTLVSPNGIIDLDSLAEMLIATSPSLVSVMLVNNEVGTIQPISTISRLVNKLAPGAALHTDAVQAPTWIDVREATRFADLASLSAHKFGGPQGVGVLIVRDGVAMREIVHGGGQERERRSGTQNVAGIVGLATALRETVNERDETVARVSALRDRLMDGLLASIPYAIETTERSDKIVSNAHVTIPGVESESLLILLDDMGLCASSGASCASGALDPSHVLMAMGYSTRDANSGLRLTLGRTTTTADIDHALTVIPEAVSRLSKVGAH